MASKVEEGRADALRVACHFRDGKMAASLDALIAAVREEERAHPVVTEADIMWLRKAAVWIERAKFRDAGEFARAVADAVEKVATRPSEPAVTEEVLREVLQELVDIVQGHLDDGDKMDSFTLQPALAALTATRGSAE